MSGHFSPQERSVTIANAADTSDAELLGMATLLGVYTPAALTGTALTFEACATSGGTFVPVYDGEGAEYSIPVGVSQYNPVRSDIFLGVNYVKVVSNAAEGGARTITLAVKPL